jgi:hypothetical protein
MNTVKTGKPAFSVLVIVGALILGLLAWIAMFFPGIGPFAR